ncbi:UPF0047-domain-containing protein [Trematosphaeria pertusa]|uniref:UPF0047-domain-containing protein n=1 Tax=Trematosphaeria pertusa TaxID=390896 RepID=A0A6A6I6C0_9PLEO|nr:UPF0047-domain-containing protein [Trematosphaeria pertusa]KAF2245877.1 UPF0047-domain-containing protein [Trematosphaeria pertusa]
MPPHQSTTISPLTTFLILTAFILAFFPGVFHSIIWAPYNYVFPPNEPRGPTSVRCTAPNICVAAPTMAWFQKTLTLPPQSRGSYLITDTIVSSLPEIKSYKTGILHLFIQHTSCALSLNENWDADVRADMSDALDRLVPEDKKGAGLYRHDAEGSDDMPAHVKSALVGASVSVPITNGRLATGTWQGIWYLEFRAARHTRRVVATIQGEKM